MIIFKKKKADFKHLNRNSINEKIRLSTAKERIQIDLRKSPRIQVNYLTEKLSDEKILLKI